MSKSLFSVFVSIFFLVSSSFTANKMESVSSTVDYLNYGIPVDQIIYGPINKDGFSVLVQKSSYTFFLKYNGRVIKSYPCVFGPDPIGDKRMQGDNRTPEGYFRITDIRAHDLWGYFMALDYPNANSWVKHNNAKAYNIIPSDANIGGDIGIHGLVDGLEAFVDAKNNWTEGCVSLKNNDVRELATHLKAGTPVTIIY